MGERSSIRARQGPAGVTVTLYPPPLFLSAVSTPARGNGELFLNILLARRPALNANGLCAFAHGRHVEQRPGDHARAVLARPLAGFTPQPRPFLCRHFG